MKLFKNIIIAVPIILTFCVGSPTVSFTAQKLESPPKSTKKSKKTPEPTNKPSLSKKKPPKSTEKSPLGKKELPKSIKKSSLTSKERTPKSPPPTARKQNKLPASSIQPKQRLTMGYCIFKGKTLRVSEKVCSDRKGSFFTNQSLAQKRLLEMKREETAKRIKKASVLNTKNSSRPLPDAKQNVSLNAASLIEKRNRDVTELSPQEAGSPLIRDPALGPRNPGEFRPDWEEAPTAPLPPGVDTGKLDRGPTHGDPEPDPFDPVGNMRRIREYDEMNRNSDTSSGFRPGGSGGRGETFVGDMNKVRHWGSDSGPQGEEGNNPPGDMTGVSSEGDETSNEGSMDPEEKNRRAAAGEDLGTMAFTEEEVNEEVIPDESTDPPDELRSSVTEQGISMGDSAGSGNRGGTQGQFTPPRDFSKEKHNREIHRRTRGVDIDPEDGGPDESQVVSGMEGVDRSLLSQGEAGKPAPGEEGPDDPRAGGIDNSSGTVRGGSVAEIVAGEQADHSASDGPASMGASGTSSSPTPEPDNPNPPPGPEFSEGIVK